MNLLILGGKAFGPSISENPTYRGTQRGGPVFIDGLPEKSPVNQAFLWSLERFDESMAVHDFSKACELVDLYGQLTPPREYEVLEVTLDNKSSVLKGDLLGYDLSYGFCNSLLWWGLNITPPSAEICDDRTRKLIPLLKLVQKHFQPQLNRNGLFDDYQTALFCLTCMTALESMHGNLWEKGEYQVVGLYLVYPK